MAEATELEGKKLVIKNDGKDKTYYEADMSDYEKTLFSYLGQAQANVNIAKKNLLDNEVLLNFYLKELQTSLQKEEKEQEVTTLEDEQERAQSKSYGGTN